MKLKKSIPIIFLHFGYADYLEIALCQAKSFNPGSDIILLGDESNKKLNKYCFHYNYNEFSEGIKDLERIYQHHNSNSFEYEFFCFKRWFIIRNFLKSKNIEWACTADSDVLLYASVHDYFSKNIASQNFEAGYCVFEQQYDEFRWVASGGIAFVSMKFLDKFCNYIMYTYESRCENVLEKLAYHKKSKVPGGIADMSLLYLYYYFNNSMILNLLIPIKGEVFNNGVYFSNNNYEAILNKFYSYAPILKNGKKMYYLNDKNEKIYLLCLHFQGGFKSQMLQFYTGRLFHFILKMKSSNYMNSFIIKFKLQGFRTRIKGLKKIFEQ